MISVHLARYFDIWQTAQKRALNHKNHKNLGVIQAIFPNCPDPDTRARPDLLSGRLGHTAYLHTIVSCPALLINLDPHSLRQMWNSYKFLYKTSLSNSEVVIFAPANVQEIFGLVFNDSRLS